MRITNTMMSNTVMMNINRNMLYADKLFTQIASTKKIQVPSDDPIIASRALKFRTNVAEIEQYQRNVENGMGWMNVTESAFHNLVESLLQELRTRCVESATGSHTGEDKRAVVANIKELVEQIGLEMNQSYAGRYVFSGFRTDQPPILVTNSTSTFRITQHYERQDIEKILSYQKMEDADLNSWDIPIVNEAYVMKLAYTNLDVDFDPATFVTNDIIIHRSDDPALTYTVLVKSSQTDIDAYTPLADDGSGNPVIHYIPETGELVMHEDVMKSFPKEGVSVHYQKSNIQKGELNPKVYFECTEIRTIQVNGADLPCIVRPNGDLITESFIAYTHPVTGTTQNVHFVFNSNGELLNADGGLYTGYTAGTPYIPPMTDDPSKYNYDMENQSFEFEFATNTLIQINSLAKDVYTDKMYSDMLRLIDFVNSIQLSDPKALETKYSSPPYNLEGENLQNAVDKQISEEYTLMQSVLYDRFNNMLYLTDRHSENAMRERTEMASRMFRLELMQSRLEQDEVNYTKLLSDNEDTDMIKAYTLQAMAEAAYAASLRAGANIVQLTLANFI